MDHDTGTGERSGSPRLLAAPRAHQTTAMSGSQRSAVESDPETDFDAFVSSRQRALFGLAVLLSGNHHDAEDLVQTVLGKAYLKWKRVAASDNPDAYLRRMMINEFNSMWRRAWRRRERSIELVPEVVDPAQTDSIDLTWQQVLRLPPRQRATIALRYYEDLTERDTAAILGCSIGTVKSQTVKALANLRRGLERGPDEED